MIRPWRIALLAWLAVLIAGCGSASGHLATASAAPPATLSLTTSTVMSGTTWAVVPMGAASGPNLFWQLFALPQPGQRWSLATPPDIATNGALVLASPGGQALTVGIRPSLYLDFSPVTVTRDHGHSWTTLPPDPGLADFPDALAAAADGQVIAIGSGGQVSQYHQGASGWTGLTSQRSLAASPAGRRCGLTALTGAAYTSAAAPLLAGTCSRPGQAGIFVRTGDAWTAAEVALPASLRGQAVRVLRLTTTGTRDIALLEAGAGSTASMLTASSTDSSHWMLSAASGLAGRQVISASFGARGSVAVVLTGGRAEIMSGTGSPWRTLPTLPPGRTVTLALPAVGTIDALAADGGTLTAWKLAPGTVAWAREQVIKVPIQYGSSS